MSKLKFDTFRILKVFIVHIILSAVLNNVQATEITESTWMLDHSMGFPVNIPVLTCRTKYIEYEEIRWYKDHILVQRGPKTHFSSHMLVLSELLKNESKLHFDNPLKLQGYYWCETDYINASVVHKYLFRITEIKTYAGKFISTKDSFGDDDTLSLKAKIAIKKKIYEEEMQEILFGFLESPNNFVTDISERKNGLQVQFYLYVRRVLHPRQPFDNELVEDQAEWQFILEYLNNDTSTIDEVHYQQILDWTTFRGINIKNIMIYSTLGCYEDKTLTPGRSHLEPPREISWPFARLGEVVIPNEACSSKNGLAVTRLCGGNFYIGARWGNPYGKCEVSPSKLTLSLKELYDKFGDDPKPAYIHGLQKLTHNVTQLTVPDVHIILDILTELSAVPELTSEEIDETFTVIDRIINYTNPCDVLSLSGGPAWNLSSPVHLYFKNTHDKKIENPVCVNFDPRVNDEDGGWGTEGCEYGGLKDVKKYDTSAFNFRLGTSVYVGCAASIIALSLTILLYFLSKIWRCTLDHSVLFWLAVSLLCCIILIFVSEMKFKWKPGCLLMSLLLHYFIIVTFGWLLVQAVMNRLRFANKTDMDEVPHFLLKAFLSVWSVPILIMIIIWLTKDYHYQDHNNCWKTISEVSYAAVIPIVVIIFITICLNMCAIYAVSCRFKKDFLIGNSIYKESVVKFRVAVTIFLFFVLTWLFGFFALNQKSKELRILFAISVSLTSYYVALFFIFHEVSFWELCQKWRKDRNKEKSGETVSYVRASQPQEDQQFNIPE
ncbi:Adhesion G-protein coupled receptor D1 like protein [Argiope bruennichi]|uniref:Adhesion G-protein coupled receptor D1 like protein n=1 Tax=Argiope bruennichi TaxID=94029 RepID=A0A8T0E619_ARGBR|nr:Adhesion G-protein coupled receptor D1 like protein [Argiope bruennichi]